jgi:chaperonin cofactor prefoldin
MGLFWDLIQQSQISSQRDRTESVESRVARLEREVQELKQRHLDLLMTLERSFGQDINGNGKIGS